MNATAALEKILRSRSSNGGGANVWSTVAVSVFDICASFLSAAERFTRVERVCVRWYHSSAHHGAGWAGAWDLLKLPASTTAAHCWGGLQLQLQNRLQPHRVAQLRCRYSMLLGSAASTGVLEDDKKAGGGVAPTCVFANCTRLTLVNDTETTDLSAVDLRVAFPRARHVHIALFPSRDHIDLIDGTVDTASHSGGGAANAASHSGGGAANAANDSSGADCSRERRRLLMNACIAGAVRLGVRRTVLLPTVSHVTHLRISSTLGCRVQLHDEWPHLESLEIFGAILLRTPPRMSMSRVTCLTFSATTMRPRASVFAVVKAAPALGALFFSSWISAIDADLLKTHCPLLHTLHCISSGCREDDMALAVPSLVDLAIYSYTVNPASMSDLVASYMSCGLGRSLLRRFSVITHNPTGHPTRRPTWHTAALGNSVHTSLAFFGSFSNPARTAAAELS